MSKTTAEVVAQLREALRLSLGRVWFVDSEDYPNEVLEGLLDDADRCRDLERCTSEAVADGGIIRRMKLKERAETAEARVAELEAAVSGVMLLLDRALGDTDPIGDEPDEHEDPVFHAHKRLAALLGEGGDDEDD